MAEGIPQQRSFAKGLRQQSALQMRQTATASLKAASEQTRPKLNVVDPLDYEGELNSRRKDLEREQFLNLLLFPQQDITVSDEEWNLRTDTQPINVEAYKEAPNLLTHECLRFFTSKWHKVTYNYSSFSSGCDKLISPEYCDQLKHEKFELDLAEEERLASLSADYLDGGTPLSRRGYLHKGPFPQDGGISVSMKTYRKRWFVLSGGPREGGYTLTYYKDEKSSNIKGKISLDTCTEVKKNSRYKPLGFDLLTEDDKVFYPLATDSEAELDEWVTLLKRAIGMEVEETDRGGVSTISSFYSKDTLKDTKKIDISPELLEYSSTTDAANARNRLKDTHPLFHVYPELMRSSGTTGDDKPQVPVPEESFGKRFLVKCHQLNLQLTMEKNGAPSHIEPFFMTLAVFDANKGLKISEDFHVDLNSPFLRQMVPPPTGVTNSGPHPLSEKATRALVGVFSVTFPHCDVYLVARLEKVLQGSISVCAEPYIKAAENNKSSQKLAQQMPSVYSRLGQYRMPFAWAVRPLFDSTEELDTSAEFSPFYRQDREKLTDEDILKMLGDYRSLHKHKLHVIPGDFKLEVVPLREELPKCTLSPSLLPLKSNSPDSSPRGLTPALEIREFPPLEAYHPHSHYQPSLTFSHHLYVYPIFLKYDTQKAFAKARNIACCIQFKDGDDKDSRALPVIYSKSSGATLTDHCCAAVLHHCTIPTFYEEVKVCLPLHLKRSHHLLFTFYHVSCEIQKSAKSAKSSTKLPPVESPVGYAWLPLVGRGGKVLSGEHGLAVSANLPPGYTSAIPVSPTPNGRSGSMSPEVKWLDGHKPLFKVSLKLDSTIYTQDSELHQFFVQCQHLYSRRTQSPSMAELLSAVKVLGNLCLSSTVQFLPLILTQLFKLLSNTSKEVENIKPDVIRLLISLVDKVVSAEGKELLRSYIEYMFVTEVDSTHKKAVHDELARLLVQYIRQQNSGSQQISQLLEHIWFFLDVMLKSMAQYLEITHKTSASRKTRYPEDFGWNLQSLVTILLTHIRDKHTEPAVKKANQSIADFVKRSFSFMDRGVVFKIVARYLEAFSIKENIHLSRLKLDFLRIVCDHEHFVALNLPFPKTADNMEYTLSDDFCRKHFLVGVLLREVESSLQYEAGPVRRDSFKILRNILAKHDCDPRYADPTQKARIAGIYFPLIPLVLSHVTRLDSGSPCYVSPMLNAASMAFYNQSKDGRKQTTDSVPGSAPGTLKATPDREKDSKDRERSERSMSLERNKGSYSRATGQQSLHRIDSEQSLETSVGSELASLFSASPLEQTLMDLDRLSVEETRDLLISLLFVLKHLDKSILLHWWRDGLNTNWASGVVADNLPSQFTNLLEFFDMLESCLYAFKYPGKRSIAIDVTNHAARELELQQSLTNQALALVPPPTGKDKTNKKTSVVSISSPMNSLQFTKVASSRIGAPSAVSSPSSSLLPVSMPISLTPTTSAEVDTMVKVEGAMANEVGLIILSQLENFAAHFKQDLSREEGDNILMAKYFSLLVLFLQVNQSLTLQTHFFASIRAFVYKFSETLFKGSADYCGVLCYEVLQCSNSRLSSTRTEATVLFYLLMRCNFKYFKERGFVRTNLQSTIAVSRLVSTMLGQSDSNLRRALSTIANFVSLDHKVQGTPFPAEVCDLMKRMKTVLSSTAQMKIHQNDHEKLVDLHYSLAMSYRSSPELRQTWLDSMAALHLKYGNYSEAAQCCIHIAGLVAEYLKIKGKYPAGCAAFRHISPNVALEESSIKEDQETMDEQTYTERNLVALLESSINYLEQAERYELMAEVLKLLQPFYDKARDFKNMMEMYGKLHTAFRKVVDVMATGKRYLGTYFRIGFYGKPFGDDNQVEYIYKEPKVTTLGEITLRLQKLYSRKFGAPEIVHIIQESRKVNVSDLDPEHAHIQITHVEPYFTVEELDKRKTRFERANNISRFVFETPFTRDGKSRGDVTKQCMMKTILTTGHWFPYVKKRIQVVDQEQIELSPIEVAIEAMEKKNADMNTVVRMDPPDLKRLQLLLGGSISAQVNQGIQEYALFLREPLITTLPEEHVERLKDAYRAFMSVCQEALELNGRLILTDQLLYQEELRNKFQQMQDTLSHLLTAEKESSRPTSPIHSDTYPKPRRGPSRVDPHRMSAILFHSISGSK